jgi:epoxyqueuosine reductase
MFYSVEYQRYHMQIQEEIINFLKTNGVADAGFARISDGPFGNDTFAVSLVIRLSDSVIDEISDKPTYTYFHHYRTVNAFIDRMCLQVGFILQKYGYNYIAIPASQSINKNGWNYQGRYSHKKAAVLAGLGGIGKNVLFLHKDYGARVRLGTVFTDCPFEAEKNEIISPCIDCDLCVNACPSGAIKGVMWHDGIERSEMFDPEKCSSFMKKEFQHIGRGAVCGICMKVCPVGRLEERKERSGTEKD